jgi:membrane protein implicated in regulation of membrane protease activity
VVKFSPRIKFIAITIDELVLVPIAVIIVYFFARQILVPVILLLIVGSVLFVAAKYYLVYPSLQEGTHPIYKMEGTHAMVISRVTGKEGKIKVGAEIWDARCDGPPIEKGTEVVILSRESLKVRVKPVD